ncbi:MAG: hypothetical protein GX112_09175 [Clostridiaceae bacterium]|jgi:fructose-1-phosphate kinase PfkB-like protein|nr:hypothetical protein [Clostridiaceae bacterium]
MKLNAVNADQFASLIRSCTGKVCLLTADGDCMVIGGSLASRIGLAKILSVAQQQDIAVACEDRQDQIKIEQFLARFCAS